MPIQCTILPQTQVVTKGILPDEAATIYNFVDLNKDFFVNKASASICFPNNHSIFVYTIQLSNFFSLCNAKDEGLNSYRQFRVNYFYRCTCSY